MKIDHNYPLASLTSFGTGGPAETFIVIEQTSELREVLADYKAPLWLFGSGANSLVSDKGLPGTTLQMHTNAIEVKLEGDEQLLIADAGVIWDDLVQKAIEHQAWGLELTSGIPGSVGAAVVGNIAAYGQAVADTLAWVEVIDTTGNPTLTGCLKATDLGLQYRYSDFQNAKLNHCVIVRAAFKLSRQPTCALEYSSALKAAGDLHLEPNTLTNRRTIIMEARKRAGSLLDPKLTNTRTAGSFFRNPIVTEAQAKNIAEFEENSISLEDILKQNKVHGGDSFRISAAHVLLAAGFKRGQTWGPVRLHPDHVLKIENTGGATSQQIYDVVQEIIQAAQTKLHVTLEPEVRILGEFDS